MRILHVSSASRFGGGERHLQDVTCGLEAKGHEVHIAVRPGNEWLGRMDHIIPERILTLPLRGSVDIYSAVRLSRYIRKNKIDIVHAHLARDYPASSIAVRIARRAKLVVTRHVLFPMSSIHRLLLGNVSRAIAVSAAVESNLRRIFPNEKVVCIPHGIDPGAWDPIEREVAANSFRADHGIPPDAFLIGTVGELNQLKGQEEFVIAANEIRGRHPNARFLCVGKDNSVDGTFKRKLRRLVKVFELEEQFVFLDWIEDTFPMLAALDVFVSASHTESFGLAILEAMAAGDAIVSTRTPGAEQLLEHERTGLLVGINDPVELGEAVSILYSDEDLRSRIGSEARKTALEKYSSRRMIDDLDGVYQSVIQT